MDPSSLRKHMRCYRNIITNTRIILLVCVLENTLHFLRFRKYNGDIYNYTYKMYLCKIKSR